MKYSYNCDMLVFACTEPKKNLSTGRVVQSNTIKKYK